MIVAEQAKFSEYNNTTNLGWRLEPLELLPLAALGPEVNVEIFKSRVTEIGKSIENVCVDQLTFIC